MSLFRLLNSPQEITLGANSVATANPIGSKFAVVRPTVDVFIAIGDAPVAAANGNACHFVGQGEAVPIAIDQLYNSNPDAGPLGKTSAAKIAAIPANSGAVGKVYISPLARGSK